MRISNVRHKWKKRNFESNLYRVRPYSDNIYVKVVNTEECTFCGLRKGTTRDFGFFPELVYCDEHKVLSQKILPFKCNCEWIGGSLHINSNDVVFICEDEFKV